MSISSCVLFFLFGHLSMVFRSIFCLGIDLIRRGPSSALGSGSVLREKPRSCRPQRIGSLSRLEMGVEVLCQIDRTWRFGISVPAIMFSGQFTDYKGSIGLDFTILPRIPCCVLWVWAAAQAAQFDQNDFFEHVEHFPNHCWWSFEIFWLWLIGFFTTPTRVLYLKHAFYSVNPWGLVEKCDKRPHRSLKAA